MSVGKIITLYLIRKAFSGMTRGKKAGGGV